MTGVKSIFFLKKEMPEQIDATAPQQFLTGETHHLFNLLPVNRFVAVHRALFADRFRFKRAGDTPGDGVSKKIATVGAELLLPCNQRFGRCTADISSDRRRIVMVAAVDRGKADQQTQIFALFFR